MKKDSNLDYIERQREHGLQQQGLSPMEPPTLDQIIALKKIPEKKCRMIERFNKDHHELLVLIKDLEGKLESINRTKQINPQAARSIANFLEFMTNDFVDHNEEEERYLFPLLEPELLKHNESNTTFGETETPVALLEAEHVQLMQLTAILDTLAHLLTKIKDDESYQIVLNQFLIQAKTTLHILKLHIEKEDKVIFIMAYNYINQDELDRLD